MHVSLLHVSCDAVAAEVLSCLCAAGQWGWTEWRLNALCLISRDLWWESGKLLANSWLSYPGGLIIFNPVDELRPDLHAGGQLLPIQPNTQSIIIFNKVSFIFFSTRECVPGPKPRRISTQKKKKKKVWGFCKHSTKRGSPQGSFSPSFLLFAKAFPSHCIMKSEEINHRVKHMEQKKAGHDGERSNLCWLPFNVFVKYDMSTIN